MPRSQPSNRNSLPLRFWHSSSPVKNFVCRLMPQPSTALDSRCGGFKMTNGVSFTVEAVSSRTPRHGTLSSNSSFSPSSGQCTSVSCFCTVCISPYVHQPSPFDPDRQQLHARPDRNPRLQHLVLKLRQNQLHAVWQKGADNTFADALSRHPVANPIPGEKFSENPAVSSSCIPACLQLRQDPPPLRLF